jgi:hypothetical protein
MYLCTVAYVQQSIYRWLTGQSVTLTTCNVLSVVAAAVSIRGGGLREHNDSPLRSQDAVAAQQLAANMITHDHHGGPTIEVPYKHCNIVICY